jgi:hypothetical protein
MDGGHAVALQGYDGILFRSRDGDDDGAGMGALSRTAPVEEVVTSP